MVTEHTNTVYNCGLCAEPKHRHHRTGEWVHHRGDSLCNDDAAPVEVRLPVPTRDAQLDDLRSRFISEVPSHGAED